MKWLLCLAVALAVVGLSLVSAPAAEKKDKKDKEEDDAQTIVYLGDRGPVMIRVHLRVDGKSHRAAWSKFIDDVFDYLDVNQSGKLTRDEVAGAPPPAVLASPGGFGGGGRLDMDADRDGVVSRDEFRDFYRKNGLPPFRIGASGPSNGVTFIRSFDGPGERPSPEALNARLFELLDTDKDGKLSKKELEAAPAILSKLDRDEDEMLTPAEIVGRFERGSDDNLPVALAFAPNRGGGGDTRFVALAEGKTDRALARRMLEHYGKGKKKLDAKALGLTKLDRDEDGWLDSEELSRMSELPPDVEITVRLGKRDKDEPFVEINKKGKTPAKVEKTKDGVVLTIDNARVELGAPAEVRETFRVPDPVNQYKAQFEAADTDMNGYLTKQQAERSRLFRGLFAVMDRDGDGKLYWKEVAAYLEQVAKFRAAAKKGCTTLVMRDEGKGLFDLIDTDGDGRLSVRELRNAAKVLMKLDADGDGKVSLTEVPRSYRGSFEQGPSGVQAIRQAVVFRAGGDAGPPPAARTKGPLWFRKMDRNRDGDVSRSEWLGPAERFDEIDTDKDGLISAEEAEAYDRKMRGKK